MRSFRPASSAHARPDGSAPDGCFLTANQAGLCGGVRIYQGGSVRNSLIAGNTGGGVHLVQGGDIANCTIVSNRAGGIGTLVELRLALVAVVLIEADKQHVAEGEAVGHGLLVRHAVGGNHV